MRCTMSGIVCMLVLLFSTISNVHVYTNKVVNLDDQHALTDGLLIRDNGNIRIHSASWIALVVVARPQNDNSMI